MKFSIYLNRRVFLMSFSIHLLLPEIRLRINLAQCAQLPNFPFPIIYSENAMGKIRGV